MIEVSNLFKIYGAGDSSVAALNGVSLNIAQGEFVAIIGPSGSGKSTLLHILGFLDRPDKGSYKIFKTEVSKLKDDQLAHLRGRLAGFIFQQFHLLRRTSAIENVELPLIYCGSRNITDLARQKLKSVGLSQRANHLPSELSGGEQQRVVIARALVNNPMIIFADEPTGNLDTKSEQDIIGILADLNRQGKTIIIVTHEKEIADHASRVITMRDGQIVSDSSKPADKNTAIAGLSVKNIADESQSCFSRVEVKEHLHQAFKAILTNKVRSFLSMLGILFGVAAVIAMLALGQGAKESMEDRLKALGSNLLSIRGGSARLRGIAQSAGSITRFMPGDIDAVGNLKPFVKKASGYVSGNVQVVYKNANWNTSIEGVDYNYGQMRDTIPKIGRWFIQEEIAQRDKVAILGTTLISKLFGNRNPVGEIIKINRINFTVIGVAPEKGSGGFRDRDDVVYIPLTTAMYRVLGKNYLDGIYAEVSDAALIAEAQEKIRELIVKRHRIYRNYEDSFHIRDMSEMQEMLSSTTETMSVLLGSIAAISLIVGGIGIMNIMLVSVTERTREIGLRKAVGARANDIKTQFLIEAVVMTLAGGFLGILLGVASSAAISYLAGWATKVTLWNILIAFVFSIAIGIFFGFRPAQKASRLNPIEALRYE